MAAHFQAWRHRRYKAAQEGTPLPPFDPPKPKLLDGLRTLLDFFESRMRNADFQRGVSRAFVTTGLVPNADGEYVQFKSSKANVRVLQVPEIALAPPAAWDDPEVLDAAALLADFEIVPRGDGTVDPDSPTTDAEEGDDDAAEDSEE